MASKIFFTGGSGFVGQNVIPVLIQHGYEVLALTRSAQAAEKVKKVGARPIMDDLTNLSYNTQAALQECDIVIHSAAYMKFTYDEANFYKINVEATQNLLQLALNNGVQQFIYISAAPVVAGSPIKNINESYTSSELPKALYPKTKAIAEKDVLTANSNQMKTVSLRPPAIWGPNNPHFAEILQNARQGKWIWIGGGNHVLSTIHVKNLAAAILAAIQNARGGTAYFVTDGERRSIKSFFTALMATEGIQLGDRSLSVGLASTMAQLIEWTWKLFRLKSQPPIAPIMVRLMGREFSVSDQKARQELGYENAISVEEGLRAMEKR